MISFKLNINQNENEIKNATGEATYVGALRAPLACSPACVSAFGFVLIYVQFEINQILVWSQCPFRAIWVWSQLRIPFNVHFGAF